MAYRKLIREIVSRLQDLLLESRRTAMTAVNICSGRTGR